MKLKTDLFPYPVLNNDLDDYIDSSFETTLDIQQLSQSNFNLKIRFDLNNKDLENLIQEEKALYAVHLEGVSSAYREFITLKPHQPEIDIKLNSDFVSRKIEVNTLIIARKDLKNYKNASFNPDYYDENFAVKKIYKGDILAFDSMVDLNIDFSNKEKPNAKSMIRISARDTDFMSVDCDGDVIQVYLPSKSHTAYVNLSKSNEQKKQMLLVTVVLPALTYVIEQIKDNDIYKEKEWYIALNEMLEKLNYNPSSIKTADSLKVSQQLLDLPFDNALNDFYKWEEDRNE